MFRILVEGKFVVFNNSKELYNSIHYHNELEVEKYNGLFWVVE